MRWLRKLAKVIAYKFRGEFNPFELEEIRASVRAGVFEAARELGLQRAYETPKATPVGNLNDLLEKVDVDDPAAPRMHVFQVRPDRGGYSYCACGARPGDFPSLPCPATSPFQTTEPAPPWTVHCLGCGCRADAHFVSGRVCSGVDSARPGWKCPCTELRLPQNAEPGRSPPETELREPAKWWPSDGGKPG